MSLTGVRCEYSEVVIEFGYDCYTSCDDGLYFCDYDCAERYYDIKPHTLDELDVVDIFENVRI